MSVVRACITVLPDLRPEDTSAAGGARPTDPAEPRVWAAQASGSTWKLALPGITGTMVTLSMFLTAGQAQWVVVASGCAAVAAIAWPVVGRRHRRLPSGHPLLFIAAGLWLTVVGEALHAAGASYPSSADAVELAALPALLIGLLRLVRARLRERPLDTLLLAAIVPASLGAVIWLPLLRAFDQTAMGAPSRPWIAVPFLVVDLLAIAMLARLALMFRGRPVAYQLLLAAFGALLGAHVSRAAATITNVIPAPFGSQTLLVLAFGLLASAALHPTLLPAGNAERSKPSPMGRAHLVFLALAVIAGPVAVTVQYGGHGQWVLAAVGGPAAISLLLIAHLGRLMREHGRLEHESNHDILTGLPNRAQFHDELARALLAGSSPAFVVGFLDLDRFKKVNDSLGHDAGDELLRQVARRLQRQLRDGDVVARLSGDEFGLLLTDVPDTAQAKVAAGRLLEAFRTPFRVDGHDLYMTPSIGLAAVEGAADHAVDLLKRADLAMYEAKRRGRNTVEVYSTRLAADAHQQLVVETRLHAGIEAGELAVHYQPKVDLQTGAVTGVEALVRWEHPQFGLVPPGAFIALAEESGLIAPIGKHVLRTACRQVQEWRAEGMTDLTLSVNLSVRQFQLQDVEAMVVEALQAAGLPPDALELEITESTELIEADDVREVLRGLRGLGVRCSIDDFGTGYTGIAYLNTLPMDTIKLDKSFVDIIGPNTDAPFVRAMIAMAHSLGLTVVAEGVETAQQAQFLRENACDAMQGYLFSPPLAAKNLRALLLAARMDSRPVMSAAPAEPLAPLAGIDSKELGNLLWIDDQHSRLGSVVGVAHEESQDGTVLRRAAVMSSAAGVMVIPILLGLASSNALPAAAQHYVAVGFARIGATATARVISAGREGKVSVDSSTPSLRSPAAEDGRHSGPQALASAAARRQPTQTSPGRLASIATDTVPGATQIPSASSAGALNPNGGGHPGPIATAAAVPAIAPVGSTPVGSTPVGSTPVGLTPVRSTPVRSTPAPPARIVYPVAPAQPGVGQPGSPSGQTGSSAGGKAAAVAHGRP